MTEIAVFAAGCFWGVEQVFRDTDGVIATEVGYTGGHKNEPTYREVCAKNTGHAEAVKVEFDPAVVSYKKLLESFWAHGGRRKNITSNISKRMAAAPATFRGVKRLFQDQVVRDALDTRLSRIFSLRLNARH